MVQRAAREYRQAGLMTWQDELAVVGAAVRPALLDAEQVSEIAALFVALANGKPGHRLATAKLVGLRAIETIRAEVAMVAGREVRPVRALLFDKRDSGNWALGWHQDRTIEVNRKIEAAGFGAWTMKQGRLHVAPPMALLERMVTIRAHIDPVDADNAPLLIAPGSHRVGRVAEADIQNVVTRHGTRACLAEVGDVWFYSTPILHASDRAIPGRRRRVLQIDFASGQPAEGLEWSDAA